MDQGRSVIASKSFVAERKEFTVELCENPRGAFIRIQEDVGGRKDAIIMPVVGLPKLAEALESIRQHTPAG